jgi:asparagine synthase (glutamine-hydrolysing)
MFENVRELPPGHIAEASASKFEQHQYFDLPNTIQRSSISFEEATERTEDKLRGSVELHMRSDVELGVQLSGGVDSSLITAIAAEKAKKKLHTFSVSFPDIPEYDESEYQKRISQRYGTEHHDYPMTEEEFATELDQTIWHYEHPLNDPNSVSSMVLAQHAKKQVTVMLSGEGADESFLGYTKFTPKALKTIRKRGFLWRHPGIRETLARLTGKPIFKVTRYDPAMFALSYADLNSVDDLIHGNYPEMSGRLEASLKAGGNIEKNVVLQDQMCDLPQWFQRADKTGMAASMELRVPFCTNGTFSLANSTPYEHHVSNAERKRVLKKVAENYMDHDQIYRKKIGFNTPLQVWMEPNRKYRKMLEQTLDEAIENKRPGVDIQHMAGLLDELKAGHRVERQCAFLWTYMNLERWHRIFFEGGWKNF